MLEGHLQGLVAKRHRIGGCHQHILITQYLCRIRLTISHATEKIGATLIDDVFCLLTLLCIEEPERHSHIATIHKVVGQDDGDVLRFTFGDGKNVSKVPTPNRVSLVGANGLLWHIEHTRSRNLRHFVTYPLIANNRWRRGIEDAGFQQRIIAPAPEFADLLDVRRQNQFLQIGQSRKVAFIKAAADEILHIRWFSNISATDIAISVTQIQCFKIRIWVKCRKD